MSQIGETIAKGGKEVKWLGVATLVAGVLALFAPLLTGMSITVAVGVLVLIGGVSRMIWAFKSGGVGPGMLQFGIGLLTLLCGFAMVTDPVLASGALTIILAVYLVVDGFMEVVASFALRPAAGWGWLLFGGVVSVLLGVMIWRQFPLSGAWAIGLFLGFKLLTVGLIMMGVGRFAQKAA